VAPAVLLKPVAPAGRRPVAWVALRTMEAPAVAAVMVVVHLGLTVVVAAGPQDLALAAIAVLPGPLPVRLLADRATVLAVAPVARPPRSIMPEALAAMVLSGTLLMAPAVGAPAVAAAVATAVMALPPAQPAVMAPAVAVAAPVVNTPALAAVARPVARA
jgi:hypothetical protein